MISLRNILHRIGIHKWEYSKSQGKCFLHRKCDICGIIQRYYWSMGWTNFEMEKIRMIKRYRVVVEAEVLVDAEDRKDARVKLLEEIESEAQQTFASWIDDHIITVDEIE